MVEMGLARNNYRNVWKFRFFFENSSWGVSKSDVFPTFRLVFNILMCVHIVKKKV